MSSPKRQKVSNRGRKDEFLHSFFEAYQAGRLRCKVYHKKWMSASIEHAVSQRMDREEARKKFAVEKPPESSVPTFSSAGSNSSSSSSSTAAVPAVGSGTGANGLLRRNPWSRSRLAIEKEAKKEGKYI